MTDERNPQSPNRLPNWTHNHGPSGDHTSEVPPINNILDSLHVHASELERDVASSQANTYEAALLLLMERSREFYTGDDNADLINAMRGFVGALMNKSMFGNPDEPLHSDQQADLVAFFTDAANRLGGQDPATGAQYTGWTIVLPPKPNP